MRQALLVGPLIRRLPFFYGWVILACVCCAAISRAGPSVATLSIFVEPMTREFGWSRAAVSGAVSLGGVLAALLSPMIGLVLDRRGARLILCIAVLTTGAAIMLLSHIQSLLAFYALFCIARLNFAGSFDLGIYGAVNSWFIARRAFATSIVTLAQMVGLMAVPLIGHFAMEQHGWRSGWLAIGVTVLVVGLLPTWLLMVRRPEDVGLVPDGEQRAVGYPEPGAAPTVKNIEEPQFTRAEALRTRAFWMLALFTLLVFPVQAGMSLHQAAHLIERGLSPATAVATVSAFSLASAIAGIGVGVLLRWVGVRMGLAMTGALLVAGALVMSGVYNPAQALVSAMLFGFGVGGLHTVLPVAWADYFGRRNFGAIRGVALTIQVTAQAAGPLLSGVLRDWTGDYVASLMCFAVLSGLATLTAVLVRAPRVAST